MDLCNHTADFADALVRKSSVMQRSGSLHGDIAFRPAEEGLPGVRPSATGIPTSPTVASDGLSDIQDDQCQPAFHQRPLHNGLRCLRPCQQLSSWTRLLCKTFGAPFLLAISVVYFAQGFKSFSDLAVAYLLKDVLKLEPATSQALTTTMAIPWGIKPLYGILSDSLPIFGYRRRSYLFICATLACFAYFFLSIPTFSSVAATVTLFLLAINLSNAFNDVVVDARMVEMARLDPTNGANDLQSISWMALSLGGILGSLLSGPATHHLGPRGVFFCAAAGPLFIVLLSLVMSETKQAPTRANCMHTARNQTSLLLKAIRLPVVWKSALWIFLSGAISPTFGQVSFYFANDVLHFTPEFLGLMAAVGYLFLMAGTGIYNALFKRVPFRHIFFGAQIALAAVSALDLLLVTRVNLKLGISDKVFVVGDEILSDILGRLKTMPMLVLSAKLCPPGVEGTLFALLMSICNLSAGVASYWGAIVCSMVHIGRDRYDNLWMAVVIRSVLKLVPVFFLFLIPKTDPQAEVAAFTENVKTDSDDDRTEFITSTNHADDEPTSSPHRPSSRRNSDLVLEATGGTVWESTSVVALSEGTSDCPRDQPT